MDEPIGSVGGSNEVPGSPLLNDDKFCTGFFCGAYFLLGLTSFFFKILAPAIAANSEGIIWLTYVTLDLWWVIYLVIAWKIQYPSKGIWTFAILSSLVDFFVSAYKMFTLAQAPFWTAWKIILLFNNLFSFGLSLLLFLYLYSNSTRAVFDAKREI